MADLELEPAKRAVELDADCAKDEPDAGPDARGHSKIGTGNHERNQPMLAVNRKFGFKPLPGVYMYRKDLNG